MIPVIVAGCLLALPGATAATAGKSCPGAVPTATFRITVQAPNQPRALPMREVNSIRAGYKVVSQTVQLSQDANKNARLALVLLPADTGRAVTVLDVQSADGMATWDIPYQPAAVLLLYGPQGVDEKRVGNLMSRDSDLVAELAGYAEQTQELESNIESLMAADSEDGDDPIIKLRNGTPSEQALFTLVRALNPAAAAYNPLAGGKKQGPTTMTGKAADAFFENAGGTFPGSGALPFMKQWLMPDTEFRTVYSQAADSNAVTLCTQRSLGRTRNRLVYIWGHRVSNVPAPKLAVVAGAAVPLEARSQFSVISGAPDWNAVDRVRDWTLVDTAGRSTPVPVRPAGRALEIDLRKSSLAPGQYAVQGRWDWETMKLGGKLTLAPLGDCGHARITRASAVRLREDSGLVPVRLQGADFQFVDEVTLKRPGWSGWNDEDLDYAISGTGQTGTLDTEIDTRKLRAGNYTLAFRQSGGSQQEVPVRVLPAAPRIDSLPLKSGTGEGEQRFVLRGAGLDRIDALESDAATFQLLPGSPTERPVIVRWKSATTVKPDTAFAVRLRVAGAPDVVTLDDALVAGVARPRLVSFKLTPPEALPVALRDGELPAGGITGIAVETSGADQQTALRLECSDKARTTQILRIRPGEKTAAASLQQLSPIAWFAALDPGSVGPPGCTLTAALESDSAGLGSAVTVGRVVRLPQIDAFRFTDEKSGESAWYAILDGRDLEVIERTGWDAANGLPVADPPRGAGASDRQRLRVSLPWPSPRPLAPLYVWLRGDTQGRAVALKSTGTLQ
jgi:hypothetical protein